jgi:hypothetical protein
MQINVKHGEKKTNLVRLSVQTKAKNRKIRRRLINFIDMTVRKNLEEIYEVLEQEPRRKAI